MSPDETRLGELPVGARGTVAKLTNSRPVARRLMELGLLPGTEVAVVRIAPLGDPLELRLRHYHLSLRKDEARAVIVRDVRR